VINKHSVNGRQARRNNPVLSHHYLLRLIKKGAFGLLDHIIKTCMGCSEFTLLPGRSYPAKEIFHTYLMDRQKLHQALHREVSFAFFNPPVLDLRELKVPREFLNTSVPLLLSQLAKLPADRLQRVIKKF
jgi:hypothetical protein